MTNAMAVVMSLNGMINVWLNFLDEGYFVGLGLKKDMLWVSYFIPRWHMGGDVER